MPDYRCGKHDLVFSSVTDHRRPGSPASGAFPAHEGLGHPDCPLCQRDAVTAVTGVKGNLLGEPFTPARVSNK